jgi:hypothetical protein
VSDASDSIFCSKLSQKIERFVTTFVRGSVRRPDGTVRGFCEFDGGPPVSREPSEGKIGRAVLTIALVAATAMLVLVVGSFVGLIVQRHFQGEPERDRTALHLACYRLFAIPTRLSRMMGLTGT